MRKGFRFRLPCKDQKVKISWGGSLIGQAPHLQCGKTRKGYEGSSPFRSTIFKDRSVAQLGPERLPDMQEVTGSIPVIPTKFRGC